MSLYNMLLLLKTLHNTSMSRASESERDEGIKRGNEKESTREIERERVRDREREKDKKEVQSQKEGNRWTT